MLGIFLDSETNGLNVHIHRLLEIAFKIVDLRSGEIKREYQAVITHPRELWEKSDRESLRINGFLWEEVQAGRQIEHVAQEVIDLFVHWKVRHKKAVFICQNPSFDRMFFSQMIDADTQEMLQWPYHWLDLASMFWALTLDRAKRFNTPPPWELGFSKDVIASHFALPPEQKPHRAMNGVNHLLLCYQEVVGFPSQSAANKE
jgi:oligoribonuclease